MNTDNKNSNFDENRLTVYWGDEIESHLVTLDDQKKEVRIIPNTK